MTPIQEFLLDLKNVLKKHNAVIWAVSQEIEAECIDIIIQLNEKCYKDADQWLCRNTEELDGLSETSIGNLLKELEVKE
jgi:hypothetical protein